MSILHWLLGPQTIGIVALIAGLIQRSFPPKTINMLYGYRTKTSMRDQQTWDEAQDYSARLMIKFGLVCLISGILFAFIAPGRVGIAQPVIIVLTAVAMPIVLIGGTERHLKKLFGTTDTK